MDPLSGILLAVRQSEVYGSIINHSVAVRQFEVYGSSEKDPVSCYTRRILWIHNYVMTRSYILDTFELRPTVLPFLS